MMFDGDEMNIFLPQSNQTRIELEEIADVQRQIITPALSVPIIGIVQDGILGSYTLTQPTMKVDWKSAMNIISYTSLDDFSAFKKTGEMAGTDLFSLIIPSNINTSGNLEIKNGQIKKGYLSSAMLGAKKPHSLIHLIWDEYGFEETKKFLDNTQRLINNFNLWNGFSVGVGDIDIPKDVETQIYKVLETKKLEIDHLITEMENNPDLVDLDVFEETIKAELDVIKSNAAKLILANLKPNNNFSMMINAGSKGGPDNIGQMGGCLGQQGVEGKRIMKKYNGRSIPYCHQHDDSAIGRGFVEQPFIKGAHPRSFVFHNMSSREGLIDTAIKSVTGDTPIIILENGITRCVKIGDWIDEQLKASSDKVEHYTEREMELLKLTNKVYIPTCDESGNVSWGEISAITRHDPGKELYEIKTHGGRHVIVTESKSLLIWNEETTQFERMSTPDVKVGDFVPVTMNLCSPPVKSHDANIESMMSINRSEKDIRNLLDQHMYLNGKSDCYLKCKSFDEMYKISMLYSRVGVYCELYSNMTIYVQDKSERKLVQNDVVLDKIISINKIDVAKYPKVYDLTVPSTLNFGLANGLHVVDTAESGYVQRKLIKSMEDLSVKYDSTVRNSNNTIFQFTYGDSGIDTTRQSIQSFEMLEKGNDTIAKKIKFTDQELKNFKNFTAKDNDKYYKAVIELRDLLRDSRTKTAINNITFESKFYIPVNFKNVINNVKNSDLKGDNNLEPAYIIKRLDNMLEYENIKISSMTEADVKNNTLKHRDEMLAKTAFRFGLYEYLSPKVCIFEHGLNKAKFDRICDKIITAFNKSVVEPGEMTGVIGAQSIGEPTTQILESSRRYRTQ